MPFEALRFIHASNVRVDAQLREIGPLAESVRRIAEDATSTAFERIVSACIDCRADFLLLTGNSFIENDQSLRARVVLLRGFERLREHGISAYVVPGESDPPAAWKAFAHLPDNVVVFNPQTDEPVAVLRDDHLIASLAAVGTGSERSTSRENGRSGERARRGDTRPRPFSIGVTSIGEAGPTTTPAVRPGEIHEGAAWPEPVLSTVTNELRSRIDYLAVGGSEIRRTACVDDRLAHNPGCAQPLDASLPGLHGCSLIEVDGEGGVHCTFLPVASVRWENPLLHVVPETTDDDLLESMQLVLLELCEPRPAEHAWIVRWTIQGTGPLFGSLAERAMCEEMAELCEVDSPLAEGVQQVHHVQRAAEQPAQPKSDDRLAAEFFAALHHKHPIARVSLEQTFENVRLPEGPLRERLHKMIGEVNLDAVSAITRRMGVEWFAESLEGDAA